MSPHNRWLIILKVTIIFSKKTIKKQSKTFKNAINLFNKDASKIKNTSVSDQVWPDALVRTGDCLFKEKKYNEALDFLQQSHSKKERKSGICHVSKRYDRRIDWRAL
jgi:tetratricopeptide (TPR) repeat protein